MGQVIVERHTVVDKAPFLYHQLPGIDAGTVSSEPSHRSLSGGLPQRHNGLADGLPFLFDGCRVVLLPAVPVAADLMPPGDNLLG